MNLIGLPALGSGQGLKYLVCAVLWRVGTGVSWQGLPACLGKWNSRH